MSRMMGYLISPTVSAKSGTGPTLIIWCTAGLSGIEAPDLRRRHQLCIDAPGLAGRHAPLELVHPLGGASDLDAAALGEDPQLLVLANAVQREERHLLGVIGEKDEVRGVPGGSARVGKWALVDQDDLLPTLLCQVVGHAVAHDPGTDHDDSRLRRHAAHPHPSSVFARRLTA